MASNTSVAEEASARPRDAGAEEISTLKAEGTKSWVDQAGDLVDNNLRIFRVSRTCEAIFYSFISQWGSYVDLLADLAVDLRWTGSHPDLQE